MAVLSALDWPIRVLIGAVVAAGVATGVVFLVRTSGNGEQPASVVATMTVEATPTVDTLSPTLQPPATEEPTPPPATEAPATEAPLTQQPTPDTRVAIRDLPRLDQIQLGADGKYFVADRGDGCVWTERMRTVDSYFGLEVDLSTDCPVDFGYTFRPERGEVVAFAP
jgi:hypothetical protein